MAAPLGGARAEDPRAPTINAKKHRRRPPLRDAKTKDPEAPAINVKNFDGGHLGPCRGSGPHM
jgi:hypothetical protein